MNGDEMDGACGNHGGDKNKRLEFWFESLKDGTSWRTGLDGDIIFKMDVKDDMTAWNGLISLRM